MAERPFGEWWMAASLGALALATAAVGVSVVSVVGGEAHPSPAPSPRIPISGGPAVDLERLDEDAACLPDPRTGRPDADACNRAFQNAARFRAALPDR